MHGEAQAARRWIISGWLIAFTVASFVSITAAADWPQWRGLNRDGVWSETNVLKVFPSGGLKVRWRTQVGFGYSSPVVADGRVYVCDSQLAAPKARERVLCFQETNGHSLWTYSQAVNYPDWAFTQGQEKGPNPTPTVQDGNVYVLGSLGYFRCFAAQTGAVIWEKELSKEYHFDELSNSSASPLIEKDLVIVLLGGKPDACVVAFNRKSGKEIWKALSESSGHSSPIVITAGGVRQLIVWTQQSITSLEPATGKVLWREPLASGTDVLVSTPVYDNQRLLVAGMMLKLDADKPAATLRWPGPTALSRRVLSNTSTPVLHRDHVFSAKSSGELVCLHPETGEQLWQTNKVTDQRNGASIHITVNGDSFLLFNDRGELIRARLTGQGYEEISRVALIEPTYPFGGRKVAWTAPAFANGNVFVRTDKELVCASMMP